MEETKGVKVLKGGVTTTDARLDRLVQFDDRSRAYPIRATLQKIGKTTPRSYSWACDVWLDQGNEGACVGFSWAHELAAKPARNAVTPKLAHDAIYKAAQKIDEWPGEDYDGTSVLAGAKAVAAMGYMKEYRWAFGLDDLVLAVGHAGPAVLGINWYDAMFNTGVDGYVRVGGAIAGGHAILCFGVNVKAKYFRLHNSWGRDWGENGNCKVSFDDMDRLLHEGGEACVPVERRIVDVARFGEVGHGG